LINEARATLDPAVGIALRELGTGNFLTVKTLLILAKTDEYLDGKRARNLYRKLSEISHENGLLIQAIDSLSRLSFLEAKYGNTEQAIVDSKAHSRAYLEFLIDTLPSLTREDKVNTIGSYNSDVLHNLSANHQTAVEAGLWSAINERGLLNHIELGQRRLAEGRKQKALASRLNDLTAISSTGFASDSRDNSTNARSAQLLLNQLTQYRPSRRFIEVNDFFDSLPADSTYIHIVRYRKIDFTVDSESMDYYGAYVGSSRGMYFVDIGKGGEIDSTIALARSSVSNNLSDSKYRLYRLYEQAVSPLLRNIKRGSTIYISLDSEMNTMPIGSLYSSLKDEQTLSDDYTIRLVSSPRDFIIDSTGRPPVKGARSVVFADPVYTDSSNNYAHSSFRTRAEFSSHNTIRSWEPLKYAGAEGASISSKIKSSLYARDRASEKNLRAIKSPIILHIAAHAFFDPPKMANAVSSSDGKSELNVYQKIEHYLYGSGIALSSPTSSGDQLYGDGIITAAEASWLELSGTELVVLSACSTGDGVSTSGLGVFGLYRSFIEAGAKSVLMSLWRVDDESTKEFMNRFYDLIKDGMSRSEAVSTTQQEFREGKAGNGKWKDPFYWAAWQLVGDWGPIKGL
jgi:CHAT domain-containing protein